MCERERKESHSIVKHIPPMFSHGIRARLALERNPSCRVTIFLAGEFRRSSGGNLEVWSDDSVFLKKYWCHRQLFQRSGRADNFSLLGRCDMSYGVRDTTI